MPDAPSAEVCPFSTLVCTMALRNMLTALLIMSLRDVLDPILFKHRVYLLTQGKHAGQQGLHRPGRQAHSSN